MSAARRHPWYGEGLRFSCHGCGHCCRIEGYVWVERHEIERLAELLGLDAETFSRRYVRRIHHEHFSLIEKHGSHDCIFWQDGCTVYAARPDQCRTFPFWPDHLAGEGAWEALAQMCPGVDQGRLYEPAEIRRLARAHGETAPGPAPGSAHPTGCADSAPPDAAD